MKLTHFEDLDCWKEARRLTRQVYEAVHQNPNWQRDMRLRSQIQSAAGAVMANIAEGFVRRSNKEFMQFLFIAMSSAAEVQSHLYIGVDQGYLSKDAFDRFMARPTKPHGLSPVLLSIYAPDKPNEPNKPNKPNRPSPLVRTPHQIPS